MVERYFIVHGVKVRRGRAPKVFEAIGPDEAPIGLIERIAKGQFRWWCEGVRGAVGTASTWGHAVDAINEARELGAPC